jgi:hypothetical protein
MTAEEREGREAEAKRLAGCCLYLAAAELIIRADRLYLEANRWASAGYRDVARIRRRIADRAMARAKRLVGDRGLPWGVPFPEPPDTGGRP